MTATAAAVPETPSNSSGTDNSSRGRVRKANQCIALSKLRMR